MSIKLNTKVSNAEKKNGDATSLIHINQHNTDKRTLDKKNQDTDKNTRYKWLSD